MAESDLDFESDLGSDGTQDHAGDTDPDIHSEVDWGCETDMQTDSGA